MMRHASGTLLQVYPMVQKLGSDLKQAALAVRDQTDREDLRTMANMYSNNLDLEMKRGGRCVLHIHTLYASVHRLKCITVHFISHTHSSGII